MKSLLISCVLLLVSNLSFAETTPTDIYPINDKPVSQSIFQSIQAVANNNVVNLTIETNLDSLMINKKRIVYQQATVRVTDAMQGDVTHTIKVSARGRSRRKYCDFPPLKLKFKKSSLKELGLNSKYKSIKLVTHCSEGTESLNNVLEEYLGYQLYNVLTNNSFKTQLVKIKYIDSATGESYKKFGILIENTDEMAERLGGEEIEKMGLPIEEYNKTQLNLLATFQYMIGNEDWRLDFLRNVKLVKMPTGKITAVPYDFDAAGLVNASYARPDADFRLKSVLQRRFMGQFDSKDERAETINEFLVKKEQLFQTVKEVKYLDKVTKRAAVAYLNLFFDIIENPKSLKRAMPTNGKEPVTSSITGAIE